jgi:hypothetical protein
MSFLPSWLPISFLQPWLLWGLPLIAVPIIIHLINQQRYQTIRWAAMMFLLAANRMSRGYARLRQWLILACRMLVIAGLVFAISRPLASGWLGLTAGGRADTTIIILDRSPSMQQRGIQAAVSKLDSGRQQLVQALELLGSSRWVLIESTRVQPRELSSPDALLRLPETAAATASADLPAMLQAARDYIEANRPGRTEIWICSDLRANDWDAGSARWQALRESFQQYSGGIRFQLLAYPDAAPGNVSVRVTQMRHQRLGDSAELLVSVKLTREGDVQDAQTIPLHFEIEGARSEVSVELTGKELELKDHRIPLSRERRRGWGWVSIPADENPADNEFYFVFDEAPPRTTVVVSDDDSGTRALQLAASIPPDPAITCDATIVSLEQLPTANMAQPIEAFVQRGGQVIFLPPRSPTDDEFHGVRWTGWKPDTTPASVASWRGDQDLLAHSLSGTPLPVGTLNIHRSCGLSGEVTSLATLSDGSPLLARVSTDRGAIYFCTTSAAVTDSSLAANGIVLYVLLHRSLAAGAEVLGNARQFAAGDPDTAIVQTAQRLAGANDEAVSTEYPFQQGVYTQDERLWALNRAALEEQAEVLDDPRVESLFQGLFFRRVDEQAGSLAALIQEIWRLFLIAMMIAMLVEAVLCLPKLARTSGATP